MAAPLPLHNLTAQPVRAPKQAGRGCDLSFGEHGADAARGDRLAVDLNWGQHLQTVAQVSSELSQTVDIAFAVAAHGEIIAYPQLLKAQVALQVNQKLARRM